MSRPQHPARRLGGLWIVVAFAVAAVIFALVVKPWQCDSVAACLSRERPDTTAADTVRP